MGLYAQRRRNSLPLVVGRKPLCITECIPNTLFKKRKARNERNQW